MLDYIEGPRSLLETWQGERDAVPHNAVSVPAGTMVREITGGAGEAWVYLIAEINGVEVSLRGRSDPVLRDPSREPRERACDPACDARYHELRTILGAGKTETITDAARRVAATLDGAIAEIESLVAEIQVCEDQCRAQDRLSPSLMPWQNVVAVAEVSQHRLRILRNRLGIKAEKQG